MEKKLTIEELEAKYKALGEEIEARKKAEAEEMKAKLAAEKDARFKEVIDAYKHADALRDAVIEDYGYFTYETEDDVPCLWDLFFKR
jgi:flagellar motility protein MotE (MotC chaperone)